MCCKNGTVHLPIHPPPPLPFQNLFQGRSLDSTHLLRNMRRYNACIYLIINNNHDNNRRAPLSALDVRVELSSLIYKREPQADPEDGITVQTMAWIDLKTAMMLQATSKLVWGYLSHLEEPPRNRHLQKTEQLRPPQRAANTVQTARRWLLLPRFQYARIVVLSDSGLGHSTRFA